MRKYVGDTSGQNTQCPTSRLRNVCYSQVRDRLNPHKTAQSEDTDGPVKGQAFLLMNIIRSETGLNLVKQYGSRQKAVLDTDEDKPLD